MRYQGPDNSFSVMPVGGICNIHVLPGAESVFSLSRFRQHVRVQLDQPVGDSVGRRSHNDIQAVFFGSVYDPVHMRKIILAGAGLLHAPGGFRDPDRIDAGFLHHLHILFQPVTGKIFLVVGSAEDQAALHVMRITHCFNTFTDMIFCLGSVPDPFCQASLSIFQFKKVEIGALFMEQSVGAGYAREGPREFSIVRILI